MQTLWLDIGNRVSMVALVRDGRVALERSWEERPSEETLMARIRDIVKEGGGGLTSLDRIAAMTGPGGFMGLRTGISIGNALAWAYGLKIGGLMKRDLDIARVRGGRDAIWLHSTRRDALFVARTRTEEPTLASIDVLQKSMKPTSEWIGDLLPEHEAALGGKRVTDLRPVLEVLPKLLKTLDYAPPPLLPWYGRGV